MPDHVYISSLVVHAAPQRVASVSEAIALVPGARVYGSSPLGKIVITLDADDTEQMIERIAIVQRTEGVLTAALVYEYSGTAEAAAEAPNAG